MKSRLDKQDDLSPWFVYILRCADDSLYTGITTDIKRRLSQHNGTRSGGAKYTRPRRPVGLAMEPFRVCGRSRASKLESFIKSLSKAAKENFVKLFDFRPGVVVDGYVSFTSENPRWSGVAGTVVGNRHTDFDDGVDSTIQLSKMWGVLDLLADDGQVYHATLAEVCRMDVDLADFVRLFYRMYEAVDPFNVVTTEGKV